MIWITWTFDPVNLGVYLWPALPIHIHPLASSHTHKCTCKHSYFPHLIKYSWIEYNKNNYVVKFRRSVNSVSFGLQDLINNRCLKIRKMYLHLPWVKINLVTFGAIWVHYLHNGTSIPFKRQNIKFNFFTFPKIQMSTHFNYEPILI